MRESHVAHFESCTDMHTIYIFYHVNVEKKEKMFKKTMGKGVDIIFPFVLETLPINYLLSLIYNKHF